MADHGSILPNYDFLTFPFSILSLAILKYKQYFLMLQTFEVNNKKRKKSSFYVEKSLVGLTPYYHAHCSFLQDYEESPVLPPNKKKKIRPPTSLNAATGDDSSSDQVFEPYEKISSKLFQLEYIFYFRKFKSR